MPKVAGRVLDTKQDTKGRLIVTLQLARKMPRKYERVSVKWGIVRSLMQNAFYWKYLTYLMQDCELSDDYQTIDELHETLKATFLSKRLFTKSGTEIIRTGSTTELDKSGFAEYLSKVDKAMVEYHNINTAPFWKDYEDNWKI